MSFNPEAPFDEGGNYKPPPSNRGWWLMTLLVFLVVVVILSMMVYAFAHDMSHPELNAWYESLKNGDGMPCCDSTEATRIQDVDWQSACKDSECHYQVHIANQWWDVPNMAVVKGPNKNGQTLVWPIYYYKDGKPENGLSSVFIRCFLPGAGG